ncbi:hypothetical protein ACNOYE_10850 [Nannocystaceae bacterium ST9]
MSTQYDPSIIVEQADRLYSQARTLMVSYAFLGLILGPVLIGVGFSPIFEGDELKFMAFVGALFGAAIGFALGRNRGFLLRFQAQVGLCQLQQEVNTRVAARPTSPQPAQWQR